MRCTKCDAALEPNSLGGLCPVCLFDAALPEAEIEEATNFRYDLVEEIARGGMGVVYRAVQHGSQRQVAVKMILAEQAATPGMMERFRAEAEAVASLDHPHILPIYEIGESDGRLFYSMKFADGGTLREQTARFSEPRDAAPLIATIARAVHHAHERGILHRDLKPGNVLLDGSKRIPFVSDFGLAKWIGRESRLTLAQSALGTPHYIAPEQAAGNSTKLTAAADIYSLGAIFYELLTGRPPFAGDTALETLRLARETPPAPPRKFKSSVPRDLEVICLKCLAKEPAARYASAAALADDLERWLEGHTIVARPASAAERAFRWTRRNRALAGLSVALIIALLLAAFALTRSPISSANLAPNKSIAVLPFENLSGDAENVYFAQGIQDEIVTRLGKIADLKVISRTSTEGFESSPQNLRVVSERLGVANLLKGTVQKSGDQVRVNVQLVEAATGAQLWSEGYDRKLTDIFRVESDIAQAVAGRLQAKLSGAETLAIARKPTDNPVAHQLYLKGRFFWNKRTAADLNKAIDYLNQAIAADPNYALAYAGLADAYVLSPFFGAGRPQDCYPKAKAAAKKALDLDGNLAEAHVAHAESVRLCDLNMTASEKEFRRGLELDPNYATGHHWFGNGVLTGLGRFDEAIAELKRAVELDPLSLIINSDLGTVYTFARRYDEAIQQYQKTLEMDPGFYYARWGLAVALELKGSFAEAQAEFSKARQLNNDPWVIALQAHALSAAGDQNRARKLIAELREIEQTRYVSAWTSTVAHLALGEKQEAINSLEKSFAAGDGAALQYLKVDPYFDPLQGDPRFDALVVKIFPASSAETADAPDQSVAVMPFVDLSQGKDQEYFCDGISEQILDSLARVEGLQVAARTSSFSFKGTKLGAKEIAAKLGVRHLLEGSLRREGNRIRVTAQLIDANNGFHIWSDTYERELQGVFAVQDEITKAITNSLKLKLVAARPAPAQNSEAYDLYLQGVFFSNKSTEEGLRKSLDFFQQSLEKDPNSARTYAGIAKAWNWLADAYVRPMDAFPQMKAAALKAVKLDDQLAEGHIWLGNAKRILDWDVKGCWAEIDRALELDPNSAAAHSIRTLGDLSMGNKQEALVHVKASVRLDPLSPIVSNFAAVAYLCAGEVDEAIVEAKRLMQLDPNYIYESPVLGEAYFEKGMYAEAVAVFQRAQQLTGAPQPGLAITYAHLGREAEARQILEELKKVAATKYIAAEEIAAVYVALGEKDEAFTWLERGYTDHGGAFHAIAIRPDFRALRSDPRFQDILRRIGLDPQRVPGPADAVEKSVAVLPFVDLSERKDQEYFCDGVTEEILGALTQIEGLRVVARTSSFAFKGKNLDVKEVAGKLGVQNIIEGSLRREGNRVRITAQLIDTRNGFHLWSQTYERELQSIFAVQDEMAKAIADALKIQLATPITRRELPNLEAYDLYLQGLALSNKSGEADLRKSLELFQRSVEKDPTSAAAWTGIAKVWLWLADGYVKPLEAYPKCRAAAIKALKINERNAEAHTYLSDCKRILDWDLEEEEVELKRALEIDPNSGLTHLFVALTYATKGKRESSLTHLEAALKADPLSPIISNLAGLLYITFGQMEKAIEQGRRTLQIDPGYVYEFPMLARAYAESGRTNEAIALYKKGEEITGAPSAGLAVLYAQLHRDAEAKTVLKKIEEVAEKSYFQPEDVAEVYIALGDKETAFKWLDRAVVEHSGPIHAIVIRPTFRALDSDPRFRAILKRIGLDPDAVLPPAKMNSSG